MYTQCIYTAHAHAQCNWLPEKDAARFANFRMVTFSNSEALRKDSERRSSESKRNDALNLNKLKLELAE